MGLSGSPAPAEGPLSPETPSLEEIREDEHNPYSEKTRKRGPSLPLQPGLTQVILEASSKRQEATSGPTANPVAGVTNYDVSLKEQKKASRLPKGSMLDKKVG